MKRTESNPINALLVLEVALRFGVWAILFQAEIVASNLLGFASPTIGYYYLSLGIAIIFVGLIRFAGPSRLVADIQELCFFDILIQLLGIALFFSGNKQTSHIFVGLSTALLLAKTIRLLWPVTVLPDQRIIGWPVFGLLGLFRGTKWPFFVAPKWHQRRSVIYACLLAAIPAGYGLQALFIATKLAPISYTLFIITLFGLQPLLRKLQQLEDERSAAITDNQAQAIRLAIETDRATHFERLSEELAASNAERARLLAEVRLSNERILHANHDIMQPVFWLTSALQLATDQATSPAQRELLDKTLLASHEISDMLSDVFHQVTHETSSQLPEQQVLNVGILGQYFWDRFFDLAAAHNVRLTMGNETFSILANEPRLRRIIANLLNNAILYSGPGAKVSLRFARRFGTYYFRGHASTA
jgi:signal transduction histidine kinase